MTTERLDAILDLDRFAVYFRWAFCQKPRGKGIILASELLSTVFRRKRYYISENEAELLAGSNFDISSFRDLVATIGKKYLKPRSWQIKRKFFQAWRELAITQGQDLIAAAAFPRSYPRFDRFLVQPPVPEFLIETGYAKITAIFPPRVHVSPTTGFFCIIVHPSLPHCIS